MPVVAVNANKLNQLLGKQFEMSLLVDALEQLGCDVEDTSSITLYKCPACQVPNDKLEKEEPSKRCDFCGYESEIPFEKIGSNQVIRIDLLANRPDLFGIGGLAQALKGYLGLEEGLPQFTVQNGIVKVYVDPALSNIRPYIACAIINISPLDHDILSEIMRLQENLHWGIGRDRKLSSIGVYNMDVIVPPIQYTAVNPKDLQFSPLGGDGKKMTLEQIIEKHPKGIAYSNLLKKYDRYPILIDSNDLILSLPPIINSEETRCKIGSSRLFIDVTGITSDAVTNSLNTLVSALIELGGTVEAVEINYPDCLLQTPDLKPRQIDVRLEDAQRWLGISLTRDEFIGYLRKMRLNAEVKEDIYEVRYPAFRTDILHPVDIFEDIAIAYGYQNLPAKLVSTMTIGKERKEEKISQIVREIMIGLGFTEVMSLVLQSIDRHFTKYQMEITDNHVVVENPKTIEQKVARSHLMTGIMETFHKNRRKAVPQRIFEIGNIISINPKMETGTDEYRHLSFGITSPDTGYAEVRAILDSVIRELEWKGEYEPIIHPAFIEGRCAKVTFDNHLCGRIGEIHPQVLNNFGLPFPVAFCEICLIKVI